MGAAAAAAAFTFIPRRVLGGAGQSSANDKLNIAGIGVGGRGASDIEGVSSENIVVLCDADLNKAAGTIKKHPNARIYRDFREMLEKEQKNIDAVVIGAPDHIHAPAAIMAMKMGKHVYCEKPMAHTIFEARRMTQVAKETGVVTQMGNQGHAGDGLRQYWEYIHDGAIGKVKEIHVWSDRAGTPEQSLVAAGRLGAARQRAGPGEPGLERLAGTRQVAALSFRLRSVQVARLLGFRLRRAGRHGRAQCRSGVLRSGSRGPDCGRGRDQRGQRRHVPEVEHYPLRLPGQGRPSGGQDDVVRRRQAAAEAQRIWTKGSNSATMGFSSSARRAPCWAAVTQARLGSSRRPSGKSTAVRRRRCRDRRAIIEEWIEACKAGKPEDAKSGFWYAGPFVEALLVGNLAVRLQKRVEWDSEKMRSPNCPEADNYITKFYRAGFDFVS